VGQRCAERHREDGSVCGNKAECRVKNQAFQIYEIGAIQIVDLYHAGCAGRLEMPVRRGLVAACLGCGRSDAASAGPADSGFHPGGGDAGFSAIMRGEQGHTAGTGSLDRPSRNRAGGPAAEHFPASQDGAVSQRCAGGVCREDRRHEAGRGGNARGKGSRGAYAGRCAVAAMGRDNLPLLESRLEELRRNRSIGDALPLARKYLPEQIPLVAKFYVVMGGRAGAAAIEDRLYFDVLSSCWRASVGKSPYPSPAEVVEFFAHEAHHLGYGQILDRKRASFQFTPAEDQTWRFLTATLMEGSATLLINGHETLSDGQTMPEFPLYLAKVPELLAAMQNVLQRALAGPMSGEDYDQSTSPFLGMGYHAAGAKILSVIYARRGLQGVMEVMADPRQLLTTYNDCASPAERFRFDAQLGGRLASMGKSQEKPTR